jgi:ABC-type lipoprotein export system ATPase subunit
MALAIDPLIRLTGVSKIFHTKEVETHALSGINLEIRAGEYVVISGPSGCGKTTLLSILGLLDTPSEGSYVLAGEPVATLTAAQRARVRARAIGFIFQAFNPAILLADEPTGNLDSTNGEAVMELLRELHRGGATICMVTHDPRYARHADRSVHLFDGKVVEERQLTAVS